MNKIIDTKNSRYGVASCLIGILNLVYSLNLLFDWFDIVNDLAGPVFGLVFIPLLFLIIPAVGNGIGLVVGMIGLYRTSQKRPFAVTGVAMNIVIPATLLIIFLLDIFNY